MPLRSPLCFLGSTPYWRANAPVDVCIFALLFHVLGLFLPFLPCKLFFEQKGADICMRARSGAACSGYDIFISSRVEKEEGLCDLFRSCLGLLFCVCQMVAKDGTAFVADVYAFPNCIIFG